MKPIPNSIFVDLKDKWYDKLILFAVSYVKSESAAQDLVQDTFLKIIESVDDVNSIDNMGALLYTILKNKALDYIRHKVVECRHSTSSAEDYRYLLANSYALEDSTIKIIINNQIRKALNEAIDKLPEQTRRVFILNKYDDIKYKEIASRLNISEKTVEYHICKAYSLLRKELGDYYVIISILGISSFLN